MTERQNPGTDLISAIELLLEISEQQSLALAQSREMASNVSELFRARLQSQLSGAASSPGAGLSDLLRTLPLSAGQGESTKMRELAFLDSIQALLKLSADESKRESVERIFHLLRTVRMIDYGHEDSDFAEKLAPQTPQVQKADSPQDQRKAMLESFLDQQRRMGEVFVERQKVWDRRIAESERLLSEALKLARELAKES